MLARTLGGHFEEEERWQRAADVYLYGLEGDDLAESLHHRLMRCYHRAGCRGEAVRCNERCRKVLAAAKLKPSPATEALYLQILEEGEYYSSVIVSDP